MFKIFVFKLVLLNYDQKQTDNQQSPLTNADGKLLCGMDLAISAYQHSWHTNSKA